MVEQPAEAWDASGIARAALGEEFTLANTATVARWPVSIWLRPPTTLSPLAVRYEGGLQLTGYNIAPNTLPPGGVIAVHLRWEVETEVVGEQESVSVQLLDAAGQLVAQSDRPLEMASVTTAQVGSYAILLPATLAAGEYQLVVVVYDPSREGAPRHLTSEGADGVTLGNVTVVSQ
jgi:hypothetical protein